MLDAAFILATLLLVAITLLYTDRCDTL